MVFFRLVRPGPNRKPEQNHQHWQANDIHGFQGCFGKSAGFVQGCKLLLFAAQPGHLPVTIQVIQHIHHKNVIGTPAVFIDEIVLDHILGGHDENLAGLTGFDEVTFPAYLFRRVRDLFRFRISRLSLSFRCFGRRFLFGLLRNRLPGKKTGELSLDHESQIEFFPLHVRVPES